MKVLATKSSSLDYLTKMVTSQFAKYPSTFRRELARKSPFTKAHSFILVTAGTVMLCNAAIVAAK